MPDPFFRGFDLLDFVYVATVAKAQIENNQPLVSKAMKSFAPGTFKFYPGNLVLPDTNVLITDDYVIVSVKGTDNWAQWVTHCLLSVQGPLPDIPGNVCLFFGVAGAFVYQAIKDDLTPALATRKLVCMGHSYGAAVAQVLLAKFLPDVTNGASCLVIGSPRVGNQAFQRALDPYVLRIEANFDPIPGLPPAVWAGIGSNFPIPGPAPFVQYHHAGQVKTLLNFGGLADGSQTPSIPEIANQLRKLQAPTHLSAYYLSGLQTFSGLARMKAGDGGYVNPPDLYAAEQTLFGVPRPPGFFIGDGPMPSQLVQGLLYFRDKAVSEGWQEAFYIVADIPTMNNHLNIMLAQRAAFLSRECEIHAYRSSHVGGDKRSQVTKLASPQGGQISNDTNEVGDSILYELKTAVNARRTLTFRGVPDNCIEKNALTAAGLGLLGSIDSFCSYLVLNGFGLKVPSSLVLKQAIVDISNVIAGGLVQVTSALAHGLSTGDVVNIQGIRGYPYLIGKWKVNVVSPTVFALVGSDRYNISLAGQGTFQGIEYVMQTATTYGFNMVGWRATGKPFGQPRGKRSAKVLHH